jgi:hypothetical protein
MKPLSINVAIIFGTRLTVTNFLNVFIPWYTHSDAKKAALKETGLTTLSPAETQSLLLPDDPILDMVTRYSDVAVQYGYMTLFATSLPIACAVSSLQCILQARAEAWLMIRFKQRPLPMTEANIGSWLIVFRVLSTLSVITNGALVCFTMNVLVVYAELSYVERLWLFIGFQWSFFTIQSLIDTFVPDEPTSTKLQEKRRKFLVSKLISKIPDDAVGDNFEQGDTKDAKNKTEILPYSPEQYPSIGSIPLQKMEICDCKFSCL